MRILKTFIDPNQRYLECKYKNNYPTYWLEEKEMDIWNTGMAKNYRTYVPIGYVHN